MGHFLVAHRRSVYCGNALNTALQCNIRHITFTGAWLLRGYTEAGPPRSLPSEVDLRFAGVLRLIHNLKLFVKSLPSPFPSRPNLNFAATPPPRIHYTSYPFSVTPRPPDRRPLSADLICNRIVRDIPDPNRPTPSGTAENRCNGCLHTVRV